MKCFYHADADGRCAGFWVLNRGVFEGDEFGYSIEIDYGKPFPIDMIQPNEPVYILDYSIEPEEMLKLLDITPNVIWIDHHKTAIEKYADFPYHIKGLRMDGIAGCMLTYCFLTFMSDSAGEIAQSFDMAMTEDAPMFTRLIADWDVWKMAYGDNTRNFIIAFNAYDFAPNSNNWESFIDRVDNDTNHNMYGDWYAMELIKQGAIMRLYRDHWAKEYCRTKGFDCIVNGYKVFALNLGLCNSEYFSSVRGDYEIFMSFCFDGTNWVFRLYSETVDVSKIAKHWGGGGHKRASGFQLPYLPPFINMQSGYPYLFRGIDLASASDVGVEELYPGSIILKQLVVPDDKELEKPQG